MHSSMTLAVMYTKPSHGDFSLLRIKSRDVTGWSLGGLVPVVQEAGLVSRRPGACRTGGWVGL